MGLDGWRMLEAAEQAPNMVFVKVAKERCAALQAHLDAAGVVAIVSPRTRLVTHLDVDAAGVPARWVRMMKRAITTLGWRFNADRMVGDYVHAYYLDAAVARTCSMPRP